MSFCVNVVTDVIDITSIMHAHVVVTFGFHQRQYMFLEDVGDVEVCVDRNGSTALTVNVTVTGSEYWCFIDATVKIESVVLV